MEDIVDNSGEWLSSVCSSDNDDIFGDRQLLPRVGDQYQVEIPELMMEYDGLLRKPTDIKFMSDFPNCCTVGLPIPIMWVHGEGEAIKKESLECHGNQNSAVNEHESVESESSQESQITSNDKDVQFRTEPLGTELEYAEEMGRRLSKLQTVVNSDTMDANFTLREEKETNLDQGNTGCHPLPCLTTDTWKDIEYDSFLLGLYIFGKNLHLVQKFVETRKMGCILSNYYGKFYKSIEYVRWSQSRKMKARRCIQGQKIFTGWRQHELLSRMFSHVSEESKNMLSEVSRRFGEGKLSLEDYVFVLRDMVGVSVLVKAVAIGNGKQDLTGTAIDPAKTCHVLPIRPEIPSGKACSSLTKGEIIKFLTGDFRLSKARSNDLFWEAVWPRLLARGWHSEQPRDQSYAGLKNSLVFLVPGVKKFSRRKLVKGNHYFDSVSDVLNKVAAEPGHLELESEAVEVSADKEECGSDPDILSDRQNHCYLQPRNSNCKKDLRKFTIVDTSLVCGEKGIKVRELRSLPITINMPTPSALSSETERDTTKESRNVIEVNNTPKRIENITESGAFADSTECVISPSGPDAMITEVENHRDHRTSLPNDKQSSKTLKFQFSRKGKSHQSRNLEPVTKLTTCKHGGSGHDVGEISIDTKLDGEELRHLSSPDRCEIKDFLLKAFQNLSSARSMACIPEESNREVTLNTICMDKEPAPEKTQSQTSIDLNLPYVPPDSVTDEPVLKNDYLSTNRPSLSSEISYQPELLNPSISGAGIEQQPAVNGRRQSTRNRPLTTKALEAFAFENCSPKKKRKGVDTMPKNNPRSSSFRRVHGKTAGSTSRIDVAGEYVAYEVDERVDGATNMDEEFQH